MTKFSPGNKYAAKLSNEDVYAIRERYALGGVTQMQLALDYGVSLNTVRYAIKGVTHQNVPQIETSDDVFRGVQQSQARLIQLLETEDLSPPAAAAAEPDPISQMLASAEPLSVSMQRIREREVAEHEERMRELKALKNDPTTEEGSQT